MKNYMFYAGPAFTIMATSACQKKHKFDQIDGFENNYEDSLDACLLECNCTKMNVDINVLLWYMFDI